MEGYVKRSRFCKFLIPDKCILHPHRISLGRLCSDKFLFLWRIVFFILIVMVVLHASTVLNVFYFFHAFTQWGLTLTTFTLFFLLLAFLIRRKVYLVPDEKSPSSSDHSQVEESQTSALQETSTTTSPQNQLVQSISRVSVRQKKLYYYTSPLDTTSLILFEMAWSAEILITIVSWFILIAVDFKEIAKEEQESFSGFMFMAEAHTVPISVLIVEIVLNRIRFVHRHLFFGIGFVLLFGLMDMSFSYALGKAAYAPVLTWKDFKTPLILMGFAGVLVTGFYLGYWIGEKKENAYQRKIKKMLENKKETKLIMPLIQDVEETL